MAWRAPLGRQVGLVEDARWRRLEQHETEIARAFSVLRQSRFQGNTLEEWLRRPEVTWAELYGMSPDLGSLEISSPAQRQVEVETKYAGYIRRQEQDIVRHSKFQQVRNFNKCGTRISQKHIFRFTDSQN